MDVGIGTRPVPADVAVDALIGYSLSGDPQGRAAELIDSVNDATDIVALDTPSGLDVTSGRTGTPCVSATATVPTSLLAVLGIQDVTVFARSVVRRAVRGMSTRA